MLVVILLYQKQREKSHLHLVHQMDQVYQDDLGLLEHIVEYIFNKYMFVQYGSTLVARKGFGKLLVYIEDQQLLQLLVQIL